MSSRSLVPKVLRKWPRGPLGQTQWTARSDAGGSLRSRLAEPFRDPLFLIKTAVSLGLLAAFCLAPRLFLHHPLFTQIPVSSGIPALPTPVDLAILVALAVLLLPVLVLRRPQKLLVVWCALFAGRTVWDQSTWQPYFYQYFFMLLSLVFAARQAGEDDAKDAAVLASDRLLVASIYVWSGLSKFNHRFLHHAIGALSPALAPLIPDRYVPWLALVMPVVETGIGIGLLCRRSRRLAMFLAIGMHASILLAIGPLGRDYNRVVWPWNVVMIFLLVVLFRTREGPDPPWYVSLRAPAFHRVVLVFFVLCPLSSFVGAWPAYLSFKLYSHNVHSGTIYVTSRMVETLPVRWRAEVQPTRAKPYAGYLTVPSWSERELGAFLPPEPAIFRAVTRRLCALAPATNDVLLVLEAPPDWRTGETQKTLLDCVSLGAGTPIRSRIVGGR